LLIDVFTALCAILPLLFISIPQPKTIVGATTSYWQDVRAGLAYVAAWPGLLAILVIALLINFLLTPTGSLMPLLITKHFGLGALELGFTDTLWGVGMIAGGLLLSVWGGFKRRIVTSLLGIVGIGVSVVLVGLAPANMFWLALVGMSISGLAQVLANGPLQAVIQSAVEPDMQGRVMALIGSGATAMTPLSLAVAGPVSDAIGIRAWYIFGGAACLLMGIVAFSVPAVMNVETNRVDALQSVPPAPVTTSID